MIMKEAIPEPGRVKRRSRPAGAGRNQQGCSGVRQSAGADRLHPRQEAVRPCPRRERSRYRAGSTPDRGARRWYERPRGPVPVPPGMMACAGTSVCLLVNPWCCRCAVCAAPVSLCRTQCGVSSAGGDIARYDDFLGARWEDSTNCTRVPRVRPVVARYPLSGVYAPILRLLEKTPDDDTPLTAGAFCYRYFADGDRGGRVRRPGQAAGRRMTSGGIPLSRKVSRKVSSRSASAVHTRAPGFALALRR